MHQEKLVFLCTITQNIFISGGSQGLGLALAKLLASAGANIVICSRTIAKLERGVIEIDVCKKHNLHSAIEKILCKKSHTLLLTFPPLKGRVKLLRNVHLYQIQSFVALVVPNQGFLLNKPKAISRML